MINIITYIIIQLFNVISSTIKSISLIKSKPWVAAVITTASYTISAIVVKLVTDQDFITVIIVTALTNIIGVPIGSLIVDKLQKDKLWVYNATYFGTLKQVQGLHDYFSENNIRSTYQEICPEEMYRVEVYAKNKQSSNIVKDIFSITQTKYYVTVAN